MTEPYGGSFDPVRCGREADMPTCEFWLGRPLSYSVGKAVEIARKHGKNIIAAEAFTTEAREGRWQATPAQLRRAGDEAWAAGLKGERKPVAGEEIADLSSGWTIAAFTGVAVPDAPVAADPLFDWSQSDDERLRHFSGAADYVREGPFPAGILDLGDVHDIAEVRVDGKAVGTLAYHPYRVEIPEGSRLEVRVVNTWPNRLIGDAARRSRGEDPYTWSNWTAGWSADDKPLPAGLLGPVKLHALR